MYRDRRKLRIVKTISFNGLFNPIKILVLCTFLYVCFTLRRKEIHDMILLLVVSVCLLTEMVNSVLIFTDGNNGVFDSFSIFSHQSLWLLLLGVLTGKRRLSYMLLAVFAAVFAVDFYFADAGKFCYYTFVTSALAYLALFVWECLQKIEREDILYFTSDAFLLLCAPVLFFFNLGLMFSFNSFQLTDRELFGIKLYTLIIYFVNFFYYLLINLYVYRQKQHHAAAVED